ncbi:ABC transporter substrate-binding protein [Agilicoccus flavus]|uniref:ABC transporter substrate-binding protein n=1 Tax=Agilicoccus flavus TaxID=2775968 RepID=UPI001CF71306|nr:spermidine/putrescine ABC transporter substrate-binding protein [Agilicoccus flavus]
MDVPLDPAVRALRRAAARSLATRREALGAGMGLAALAAVAACAPPPPPAGGGLDIRALPADVSARDRTLRFSNWTAYLDLSEDAKTYPTLAAFEKRTGIDVAYAEDIDDNDTYFTKIAPQLRSRQDVGADLFVFTDWMINRLIRERLVAPLELLRMPNATHLLDTMKDAPFDPGRHFSLAWQGGFGGIGYNRRKLGRDLRSIEDLWADDLRGKVVAVSEFRDTAGLVMLAQGVDITGSFGKTEVENAFGEVEKRIADGHIRRIRGNSYLQDLKSGNALAGLVWSGDLFSLRAETGDDSWQFVLPDSGGTLWTDNVAVPVTSPRRRNAEALMNYYYDPAVAAQVAAYVTYVCPVRGAQEAMEKIDPALAKSPFVFPTDDFLRRHARVFRALDADEDAEYGARWAKVVGN